MDNLADMVKINNRNNYLGQYTYLNNMYKHQIHKLVYKFNTSRKYQEHPHTLWRNHRENSKKIARK